MHREVVLISRKYCFYKEVCIPGVSRRELGDVSDALKELLVRRQVIEGVFLRDVSSFQQIVHPFSLHGVILPSLLPLYFEHGSLTLRHQRPRHGSCATLSSQNRRETRAPESEIFALLNFFEQLEIFLRLLFPLGTQPVLWSDATLFVPWDTSSALQHARSLLCSRLSCNVRLVFREPQLSCDEFAHFQRVSFRAPLEENATAPIQLRLVLFVGVETEGGEPTDNRVSTTFWH